MSEPAASRHTHAAPCAGITMWPLLPLASLLSLGGAEPAAEAALLLGGHGGHHATAGYGYEAAGYCANGGSCVPPVLCAANYLESLYDPAAACYLAHGTPGVCCLPRKHPCEFQSIQLLIF